MPIPFIDRAQAGRLIEIKAEIATRVSFMTTTKRGKKMISNGTAFVILAICAFSLFGGVLAWASWMEYREKKHRN